LKLTWRVNSGFIGPKLLIRWYLYKPTLVCLSSGYVYQTVRDEPLSAAVRLSIIVAAFTALMGLNEKQKYFSLNSQQYMAKFEQI